jgi:hypothetical protein
MFSRVKLNTWVILIFSILCLFLNTPGHAASLSTGWAYFKTITISNANVGSDLENFPLYVGVSGDSDLGAACQSSGYDIRFCDASGNVLSHEREAFSVSNGAATGDFWVLVPTISSSSSTVIKMYYGNSSAEDGSSPASAWTSNYLSVWHASPGQIVNAGTTSMSLLDSTSNSDCRPARNFCQFMA